MDGSNLVFPVAAGLHTEFYKKRGTIASNFYVTQMQRLRNSIVYAKIVLEDCRQTHIQTTNCNISSPVARAFEDQSAGMSVRHHQCPYSSMVERRFCKPQERFDSSWGLNFIEGKGDYARWR